MPQPIVHLSNVLQIIFWLIFYHCWNIILWRKKMLATRGLALSRALLRSAPKTICNGQTPQLQQLRKMSGAWRYRTGAAPHPRSVRWTAEIVGGCEYCKCLQLIDSTAALQWIYLWHNYSCVVVDPVAFLVGLWPYYRRVSIPRSIKLDWCRTGYTAWWWVN